MRKYCLIIVSFLLLCFTPALMAQGTTPAATKEANIRRLLKLTDASGTFKRSIEAQMNTMRVAMTQIPAQFWDEVLKEVSAEKFIELVIPIYDRHFSSEEIEGMIAFYETPLGKKFISTLPQIISESAAAGDKYGQEIANKVIKKMQAEGTFPSGPPAEAGKPAPPRR
jgi:hypothetical protein